jgi:hypothetical protein
LPPDEGDDDTDAVAKEQSVRVMYEDPRQREEKKRLMSLLGNTDPSDGRQKPVPKRGALAKKNSARLAGF